MDKISRATSTRGQLLVEGDLLLCVRLRLHLYLYSLNEGWGCDISHMTFLTLRPSLTWGLETGRRDSPHTTDHRYTVHVSNNDIN